MKPRGRPNITINLTPASRCSAAQVIVCVRPKDCKHMSHYCHRCAGRLGYLQDVYTSDPLQSQYQLDKFIKHTLPLSHPSASVFNSTSTGDYANYVVDAAASGAVELDAQGRRNFIWLAGQPTGFSYKDAVLVGPTDGVKVVLSSEATRVHAFPVKAADLVTHMCACCGGLVST